jgi:hypothetical protein
MENRPNSLELFKNSLEKQGFISPMLGTLTPHEKLRRPASHQEIFGYVLDGELALETEHEKAVYNKHEIFFIDGHANFEIRSGAKGAEYLFAFKNKTC